MLFILNRLQIDAIGLFLDIYKCETLSSRRDPRKFAMLSALGFIKKLICSSIALNVTSWFPYVERTN